MNLRSVENVLFGQEVLKCIIWSGSFLNVGSLKMYYLVRKYYECKKCGKCIIWSRSVMNVWSVKNVLLGQEVYNVRSVENVLFGQEVLWM